MAAGKGPGSERTFYSTGMEEMVVRETVQKFSRVLGKRGVGEDEIETECSGLERRLQTGQDAWCLRSKVLGMFESECGGEQTEGADSNVEGYSHAESVHDVRSRLFKATHEVWKEGSRSKAEGKRRGSKYQAGRGGRNRRSGGSTKRG